MKLSNVFTNIILESVNYEQMFNNMDIVQRQLGIIGLPNLIKDEIKWAKQALKKSDRIVWWLRQYKIWLIETVYNDLAGDVKGEREKYISEEDFVELKKLLDKEIHKYDSKTTGLKYPDHILLFIEGGITHFLNVIKRDRHEELAHFLSLDIPKIQNKTLSWETYDQVKQVFRIYEDEWKRERKSALEVEEGHEVFLDVGNGYVWYNLNKAFCEKEGSAMGHCGNVAGKSRPYERILSLRKKKDGNTVSPYLTFIWDTRTGELGEMKGRGNDKPADSFHKYIIPLIMDKRIEGIKGGGYLPENNFSIKDLPEDVMEDLLKKKPELMDDTTNIEINGLRNKRAVKFMDRAYDLEVDEKTGDIIVEEYSDIGRYMKYGHVDKEMEYIYEIIMGDNEFESSLDEDDLLAYITDADMKVIANAMKKAPQTTFEFIDLNDMDTIVSLMETHYPELITTLAIALGEANKSSVIHDLTELFVKNINAYDDQSESPFYLEFQEKDKMLTSSIKVLMSEDWFLDACDYGEGFDIENGVSYIRNSSFPSFPEIEVPNELYKNINTTQFSMDLRGLVKEHIK